MRLTLFFGAGFLVASVFSGIIGILLTLIGANPAAYPPFLVGLLAMLLSGVATGYSLFTHGR